MSELQENVFIDTVGYAEERVPDLQYSDLLKRIIDEGVEVGTQLDESAKTLFGAATLTYDLQNGFPMITQRDLTKSMPAAIGELAAFINGARTVDELKSFGNNWWGNFLPESKTDKRGLAPGDLGPGSYGDAYASFPAPEGSPNGPTVNQIEAIVAQIKDKPHLRTHVATTVMPSEIYRAPGYTQTVTWVPCHGSFLHFRALEDKLHLNHVQRSGDVPVGVVFNMIQYGALLLAVAKETDLQPGTYTHHISDAHVYSSQYEAVDELLSREPKPLPKVLVRAALRSTLDMRKDDFKAVDYQADPFFLVPTANG